MSRPGIDEKKIKVHKNLPLRNETPAIPIWSARGRHALKSRLTNCFSPWIFEYHIIPHQMDLNAHAINVY